MPPKGKAKGKAAVKKDPITKGTTVASVSGSNDDAALEEVLRKWCEAKEREAEAHKEVEACKTKVEAEMMKRGTDSLKTESYEVTKRTQSRESVGKADLPADIWATYAKSSSFTVLALKELAGKKKKKA
mmetsp:Transcript_110728/g.319887  ORF Transcript_110728/g.319887 Transcript_110728/m.319887 type:complete len:129 (-) Transcript_110728:70-456(-)|eukprot:CAMPEP_0176062170 /NCGR_PEP_ID=MMETSP0120_2-20121206/31001_1 /TAXON_ID=160619 /ORGANISM="Kryptoperidinium foliaceum, Strain CCMP 1326" /LENGTH=128 /DNA_ID=CAMNT_0017395735 /DNA_START=68 /DNA_END=454 /DNA_ORIENTATION=+